MKSSLPLLFSLLVSLPSAQAEILELGVDDHQISDMSVGTAVTGGSSTATAYNPFQDEFLVVWTGREDGETGHELYAQRIDATTGAELGTNDLRLTDMGEDGGFLYYLIGVGRPSVVFNANTREYLVCWSGNDLGGTQTRIFVQRLDEFANEIGTNDMPVSSLGDPAISSTSRAYDASLAFAPDLNEYMVVFTGLDASMPSPSFDIFAVRLDGTTAQPIGTEFPVSDMGSTGQNQFSAYAPDVVYNASRQEYFVVWYGDDDAGALADGEFEVYGQRLDAVTGAELGTNDIRLSDMGSTDGDVRFFARSPRVGWNSIDDLYLVTWFGDDDAGALVDYEFEGWGQLVDGNGAEVGTNDFRITFTGPDGSNDFSAFTPEIEHDPRRNEWVLAWVADDLPPVGLGEDEEEIFARRLDGSTGNLVGPVQRLTTRNPTDSMIQGSFGPSLARKPQTGEFLLGFTTHSWPENDLEEAYVQRFVVIDQPLAASETVRLGTPPNPSALTPGTTSPPILGADWDPRILHLNFVPMAVLDVLVTSLQPFNAPAAWGTVLLNPAAGLRVYPPVAPGQRFSVRIPADASLIGVTASAQGVSWSGTAWFLTNAIDVTVGTF